jgi:hypothetical protein
MQVDLDLTDSQYQEEQDEETGEIRRVAVVTGQITGINATPRYALWDAINAVGVPQIGNGYGPDPAMILRNRLIRGINESDDSATLQLRFATPTQPEGGGGGSQFVLRDSSILISEMAEFDPDSGKQMKVQWQNPAGTNVSTVIGSFRRFRPARTIVATGQVFEPIPGEIYDTRGRVNEFSWMDGLPGEWIVWGLDIEVVGNQTLAEVQVTLAHNPWMWSAFEVFKRRDGLFVPLRDNDIAAIAGAQAQPYQPGQLIMRNGISRLDYPLWFDFASVLGIPG